MKSFADLIDPDKMYEVSYNIYRGKKTVENTKLLGRDLTENQIIELAVKVPLFTLMKNEKL